MNPSKLTRDLGRNNTIPQDPCHLCPCLMTFTDLTCHLILPSCCQVCRMSDHSCWHRGLRKDRCLQQRQRLACWPSIGQKLQERRFGSWNGEVVKDLNSNGKNDSQGGNWCLNWTPNDLRALLKNELPCPTTTEWSSKERCKWRWRFQSISTLLR